MTDAIFERRGDTFFATELARGPWDPDAQHGGAPAARDRRDRHAAVEPTLAARRRRRAAQGRIGRSLQSLYVATSGGRP